MNSRCLGVRTFHATVGRRTRRSVGTGHTPASHQPCIACAGADAIKRVGCQSAVARLSAAAAALSKALRERLKK